MSVSGWEQKAQNFTFINLTVDQNQFCDHKIIMANSKDNIDKNSLAHDRVYKGLRLKIMYGQIQPGQSLTLRGIGESYGVSMTPSREAVRRLVAEGALAMTASGRVFTPELTNERIEELGAMRSLIEVEL